MVLVLEIEETPSVTNDVESLLLKECVRPMFPIVKKNQKKNRHVGMMPLNFDACFLTLFSPQPVEYESHGGWGWRVLLKLKDLTDEPLDAKMFSSDRR